MAPASKAQQRAVAKYESANYDKVLVRMPKGKKEIIKTAAENQGKSVNGFINEAIDEAIRNDKEGKQ